MMAKFVQFETDQQDRFINPATVRRVYSWPSGDEKERSVVQFDKDDKTIVHGSADEVARRLSGTE